jgi:hypothetical protein
MAARADIPLSQHVEDSEIVGASSAPHLGVRTTLRAMLFRFQDDRHLVRLARRGDQAAFQALASRYRGRLRGAALERRGIADPEVRALHDMVLSAFRDIDSFAECCAPGTWLYLNGFSAAFALLREAAGRQSSALRVGIRQTSPTGW